jgi:hypothetical protein
VALIDNTAEGGSNTTSVTTGNSGGGSGTAFSAVSAGSGGSITFTTTNAYRGNLSYAFVQPTGATTCLVDMQDASASASFAVRFYIRIDAYPSSTGFQFPAQLRTTGGQLALNLSISTTGQFRVNSSASSSFTTAGMSLNTWYRVEWTGTGIGTAGGSSTVNFYLGDSTSSLGSSTLNSFTTAAQVQVIRFGKYSGAVSSVVGFMLDDIAVNIGSSTPIGPTSPPVPPDAGADQVVMPGATVNISGTGTGNWTQTGGYPVTLSGTDPNRSFTAPSVASGVLLTFAYGGDAMTVEVLPAVTRDIVVNTAEGGTNATAVSTGNSGSGSGTAFTSVSAGSGGTITFSTAAAYDGSLGYAFVQPTAATVQVLDHDHGTTSASWTVRFYLQIDTLPSGGMGIGASIRSATNRLASINLTATGKINISLGATQGADSTPSLAVDTWYRFEWHGTGFGTASSACDLEVYAGDDVTPFITRSLSGVTTAEQAQVVRYGKHNGTGTISFWMDEFASKLGTNTPLGAIPAGSAGADQSVEPWSTVTLTGTGSFIWYQLDGDTVTLGGSGATRTFDTVGTIDGETLTFAYGGDWCDVAVLPVTERAVVGGEEVPLHILQVSS